MREHGADGIDGNTEIGQDSGVGVPEAVEGDVAGDSGGLEPVREGAAELPFGDAGEDVSGAGLPEEFVCFLGDREEGFGFCLLGADADAAAAVRVLADVLPFEGHDVTDTEAGEAAEEGSALGDVVLAGRFVEGADFFQGEELFVDLNGVHLGEVVVEVFRKEPVFVGLLEDGTEAHPVVGLGVLAKGFVSGVLAFGGLEVVHELSAEVYGEFSEGAPAVAEVLEVEEGAFVAAGVRHCNFLEVGEEIHLHSAFVNEAELLVDDGDFPEGADGLGLLEFFGISFPL